jgi:hypothetical protein
MIHLQPRELFVNGLHISHGGGRVAVADGVDVDWHESEKFFKLALSAQHTRRPLCPRDAVRAPGPSDAHQTSWKPAKFEACNHRFVFFAGPGWGVTAVNDATNGQHVTSTVHTDGATTVTYRGLLPRVPSFRHKDPEVDEGTHRFPYARVPGTEIGDLVGAGRAIKVSSAVARGVDDVQRLISIVNDAVVYLALMLASDQSGDLIVSVHEALGHGAPVLVTDPFTLMKPHIGVLRTNSGRNGGDVRCPRGRGRRVAVAAGPNGQAPFARNSLRWAFQPDKNDFGSSREAAATDAARRLCRPGRTKCAAGTRSAAAGGSKTGDRPRTP